MTTAGSEQVTELRTPTLRIHDPSSALLELVALAGFLHDLETVYVAVANHYMLVNRSRRDLDFVQADLRRQQTLSQLERYAVSRRPTPLVVKRIEVGSLWLDLVVHGITTAGGLGVVVTIFSTVMRALRNGPGYLAEWAALPGKARAKRIEADAEAVEAQIRLQEGEAALARMKAVAPNLTARLVDDAGTDWRQSSQ